MANRSDKNYREYCKARNVMKATVTKECKIMEKNIAKANKPKSKTFWKYVNLKRKTKSGISE